MNGDKRERNEALGTVSDRKGKGKEKEGTTSSNNRMDEDKGDKKGEDDGRFDSITVTLSLPDEDGAEIQIAGRLAKRSIMIGNMMQDMEGEVDVIAIPNFSGAVITKAFEFVAYCVDNSLKTNEYQQDVTERGDRVKEKVRFTKDQLAFFDSFYEGLNHLDLLHLVAAGNFLDIFLLVDLAASVCPP